MTQHTLQTTCRIFSREHSFMVLCKMSFRFFQAHRRGCEHTRDAYKKVEKDNTAICSQRSDFLKPQAFSKYLRSHFIFALNRSVFRTQMFSFQRQNKINLFVSGFWLCKFSQTTVVASRGSSMGGQMKT